MTDLTTDLTQTVARNLRILRLRAGLSQERAARRLDLSVATWRQWEYGEIRLSTARLEQVAGLFGIPVTDLVTPIEGDT